MGSWDTQTFRNWWAVKLGVYDNNFTNRAMETGTLLEIPIIRKINETIRPRIRIGKRPAYRRRFRVRVNYDGLRPKEIVEIKTASKPFTKVPRNYWMQCQVLMWVRRANKATLYVYQPNDIDYLSPYFPDIDPERMACFRINYDAGFIKNEYLPRVRVLARALRRRDFPKLGDVRA